MAEKISFSLDVSVGEAIQQTGSLKAAIREAEKQTAQLAQQFGATSAQAINAAKNTAKLKEEMSDLKQTVAALNPEAKFASVGQLAQSMAGGFAAMQGAMALVGTESKDLEKTLLKVQAAMALSQGINELRGLGDAFSNLKVVIATSVASMRAWWLAVEGATVAEKLMTIVTGGLNAVMSTLAANPVVAMLVALGAAIGFAVKQFIELKDAQKAYAEAVAKYNEWLYNKEVEEFDKRAAAYKHFEEQRVLEGLEGAALARQKALNELKKFVKDEEHIISQSSLKDEQREYYETQLYNLENKKKLEIEKKYNEDLAAEKRTATEKRLKDNEIELGKMELMEAKKVQIVTKANEDIITSTDEVTTEVLSAEKKQALAFSNTADEIAEAMIPLNEKMQFYSKVASDWLNILQDAENVRSDNKINKLNKETKAIENRYNREIELAKKYNRSTVELEKSRDRELESVRTLAAEERKKNFKRNQNFQALQTFINASAASVATFNAMLQQTGNPYVAGGFATGVLTQGLAQVAIIKAQKYDGDGGGDSSSNYSGISTSNSSAGVNTNPINSTNVDANSINNAAPNTVIRAVVVEGDITNSQQRQNRILNQANLPG